MSDATAIIGHGAIVRELTALALGEDPPHALLFAGPEGTGRQLLAREYARLLNCEALAPAAGAALPGMAAPTPDPATARPCGACRQCRLIDAGSHPDVVRVEPGDVLCKPRPGESHEKHPTSRDIRICQVRGVIELAARYPFEGRYRLILVDPAERLAREASNTILKTLEEPPGHTIFALVTAAPEALLETIISRCRRIDVPIVPRAQVEAGLVARGIAPELAATAAEAARGRPGLALRYAAEPELMGDRERLLERCAKIAAAGLRERLTYAGDLAERYREDRAQALRELDTWERFWEQRLFATAQAGTADREAARAALAAMEAIAQARADIEANVVPRMALELMLLGFPRLTLEGVPEKDDIAAHA